MSRKAGRHSGETQSRSELSGAHKGGEEAGQAGWRAQGPWPDLACGGVWEAQEFGEQGSATSTEVSWLCWLIRKFPGCSMQQELDRKLLAAGRVDRYGAFVQARGAVTRTEVGDTLGMGLETPDRWCLSP